MSGPILVTGASGFVGSHLLDLLAHDDDPVVAWSRSGHPRHAPARPPAGSDAVRWEPVDLLEARRVSERIRELRPAKIYHLAGSAQVGTSWQTNYETLQANVLGTHHLLEAVRSITGCRVLVAGSAAIYAEADGPLAEESASRPSSPYGLSKLAQEMVASEAARDGLDIVVARAFNHIGPRQDAGYAAPSFARQIAAIEAGHAAPAMKVGNLSARRDLTDVRDTVRAYRLLMTRGRSGRPYNVCSGRACSLREVVDGLLACTRIEVTVEEDPARLRRHDAPLVLGNPARIHEEIGWTPAIDLEQTLRDLLDYWRKVMASPSIDARRADAQTAP
ncbi:MAG: GDP-mannose 4,6-dehydratase [Acidobacteria bacterium]|nr:GDP-mannose 4,6-dehydratase [Acidobacteriota bacterium]